MHGMVKSIACEAGDSVAEGTTIVVVEAMKMQNPLFAPVTGKVFYIWEVLGLRLILKFYGELWHNYSCKLKF